MENEKIIPSGKIDSAQELGDLVRKYRKQKRLTQEEVTYIANTGNRFLSELERGKESAQLGKTIAILKALGLELVIKQRQ